MSNAAIFWLIAYPPFIAINTMITIVLIRKTPITPDEQERSPVSGAYGPYVEPDHVMVSRLKYVEREENRKRLKKTLQASKREIAEARAQAKREGV
jgi:hypothetical protein